MRIASAAHIPMGVERLPEDCPVSSRSPWSDPAHDKVFLTGKRVGDALNALVTADPRYAWVESNGVIVIRPVTAWANRQHFLHRTITSFSVVEQDAGFALQLWRQAVREDNRYFVGTGRLNTEEGLRPFTVTIAPGSSAISALGQLARAHGRLVWEVQYREPFVECRFASVVFRTTQGLWNAALYAPMASRFGPGIDACLDRD
jgi:hypothetical protein